MTSSRDATTIISKPSPSFLEQTEESPSRFEQIRDLLLERKALLFGAIALLIAAAGLVIWALTRSSSPASDTASNASTNPPLGMVSVTGGKFVMGNNSASDAEKPEHEESVAPFFLDRNEVTVEEYYKFVKAASQAPPKSWSKEWREGKFNGEEGKLPVTGVNWFEARKYAEWAGKRLPTEEEWEFAARGADKRLYPWGNDYDPQKANLGETDRKAIKPVGKHPQGRSPFDALDMSGNVAEWTDSDFVRYPERKVLMGAGKIVRGGSFLLKKAAATATARASLAADDVREDVGFRCAKNVR